MRHPLPLTLLILLLASAACGDSDRDMSADDGETVLDAGASAADAGLDARVQRLGDAAAASDSSTDRTRDAARSLDDASSSVPSDAAVSRRGFPPVSDIAMKGPFVTKNPLGDPEGPGCVIHRPATLGMGGLKHPLIVWGMGTGGFNTYQESFELWASHGFLVTASLQGNGQGDGKTMLACLQYACDTYAASVDCRAGATGHSQGGGGALMVSADQRVLASAPIQAYTAQGFGGFDQLSFTQQRGPMLLLSGTLDTVATPSLYQQPVFEQTNVPVFWANLIGADHVTTGINGAADYRSVVLAWFRLQLMDDLDFRAMFYGPDCSLCANSMWMVQRKDLL